MSPRPTSQTLSDTQIAAIVLAAGKGTRMKSTLPKVLHRMMGKSMLDWVLDTVLKAGVQRQILVLSPDTQPFSQYLETVEERSLAVAVQKLQRGTGDAVASAAAAFQGHKAPHWTESSLIRGITIDSHWVLICAGDTPAITQQTLKQFMTSTIDSKKNLGVLAVRQTNPKGYGRILQNQDGGVIRIIEERDADADTKKINLCNSGVIFAQTSYLFEMLEKISPNNAQNEYYLTDIFAASSANGHRAHVFESADPNEFSGVNDRVQLVELENLMMQRRMTDLMNLGITFHRPETIYLEADVVFEADCEVFPGASFIGKTRIARNCRIGPGAVLEDTVLGAGSVVHAQAVLSRCRVSAGATIYPHATHADSEL